MTNLLFVVLVIEPSNYLCSILLQDILSYLFSETEGIKCIYLLLLKGLGIIWVKQHFQQSSVILWVSIILYPEKIIEIRQKPVKVFSVVILSTPHIHVGRNQNHNFNSDRNIHVGRNQNHNFNSDRNRHDSLTSAKGSTPLIFTF